MPRERYSGDLEPLAQITPIEGLDTWRSKLSVVHDHHLTDLSNVAWDRILGAVSNAKGRDAFSTAFSNTILGIGRFTNASTTAPFHISLFVIADAPNSWRVVTDAGAQTTPTLPITLTAGRQPFFSTFSLVNRAVDSIIMVCNGIDRPLKLIKDSLTAATRVGIDKPTSAPAVAAGAAGNLNGSYQWRVTFESPTHESSPGPPSAKITLTNQQANLTLVPTSPDTQVTKRDIYRIGGTIGEWLFVGSINDNTTTTFTDNVADTSLDATKPLGFFRDPPDSGIQGWLEHKQRAFGFKGNILMFSNNQEPEGWDPLNQFPVGGSAKILAIGTTGSVLVILKDQTGYVLLGESLSDFILVPAFKKGILAPRSIAALGGWLLWLADDGVRMTDGKEIRHIGHEMRGKLNTLTTAQQATGVGIAASNHYLIAFPGFFTIDYDLITEKWSVRPWAFDQGVSAYDDNGLAAFVITQAPTSTLAATWPGAGFTDLGVAQSWFIEKDQITGLWLSRGSPWRYRVDISTIGMKRYRSLEVVAPAQTGITMTLTITMDGDTVNKQFVKTLDFTKGPARVGLPPRMIGKLAKIRLDGTHSVAVELHGVNGWGYVEREYGSN